MLFPVLMTGSHRISPILLSPNITLPYFIRIRSLSGSFWIFAAELVLLHGK